MPHTLSLGMDLEAFSSYFSQIIIQKSVIKKPRVPVYYTYIFRFPCKPTFHLCLHMHMTDYFLKHQEHTAGTVFIFLNQTIINQGNVTDSEKLTDIDKRCLSFLISQQYSASLLGHNEISQMHLRIQYIRRFLFGGP